MDGKVRPARLTGADGCERLARIVDVVGRASLIEYRRMGFQRQVPGPEGDIMTYVEEIKQQGRLEGRVAGIEEGRVAGIEEGRAEGRVAGRQDGLEEGRLEGQVRTIENLLRAGAPWPLIKSATGVDAAGLRALKQRLTASSAANGSDTA